MKIRSTNRTLRDSFIGDDIGGLLHGLEKSLGASIMKEKHYEKESDGFCNITMFIPAA